MRDISVAHDRACGDGQIEARRNPACGRVDRRLDRFGSRDETCDGAATASECQLPSTCIPAGIRHAWLAFKTS